MMQFSLTDYKKNIREYTPPSLFSQFTKVDRVRYKELREKHLKGNNDIGNAFDELKIRTSRNYFHKVYPIQSRTLGYSSLSFPAYRFILPEVITEDWIATVDWHKFQRDHVLHQPLTGYIALKLLGSPDEHKNSGLGLPSQKRLLDTCVDEILKFRETAYLRDFLLECGLSEYSVWLRPGKLQKWLWKQLFIETAYLAAVFHDLGYPWQYVGLLGDKLEPATAPAMMKEEAIEHSILSSFKERLIYNAMNGYLKPNPSTPAIWEKEIKEQTRKALTGTHGFPGALGFLFLNDCIRQFPDKNANPIRQLCIEWAAVAIMMHDMMEVYLEEGHIPERPHLRLDVKVDPLSSLITLADVLQDFERPVGNFSITDLENVKLEYHHGCSSTEINLCDNSLIIDYEMTPKDLAFKRSHLPGEEEKYFNHRYGFLNLKAWGIDNVVMKTHKQIKCPMCQENDKDYRLSLIVDNFYKCKLNHKFRLTSNVSGDGGNCTLISLDSNDCDTNDTWPVECQRWSILHQII